MKIVLNGALLNRRYSGVEVSIANLAAALAGSNGDSGDDIRFLVPVEWPGADITGPGFTTSRVALPAHFRPLRIAWEQVVLPSRMVFNRPDALHCPGYVAALASPVPVVLTIYDCQALTHPEYCRPANSLYYRLLMPLSVARAGRVIVPSEHTRRELVTHFPGAAAKCRVIPLGIGKEFIRVTDPAEIARVRAQHSLPSSFMLFVGRTDPRKNVGRLIDAFGILKRDCGDERKLVIAGQSGGSHAALVSQVRRLGMEKEVIFTGFVPPENLPALYSMADCLVFPSLDEGFGLPPLEAMECGTPVVTSNTTALSETTGDAALQVNPGDSNAIAAAVRELLTRRDLAATLAAKGLERCRMYTWEKAAAETRVVYHELAGLREHKP